MHAERAFLIEPSGYFIIANHQRVGAFGDFHRISQVIFVPMRNQDEVRRYLFYVNGGSGWVR
jgi:hypothetical protein